MFLPIQVWWLLALYIVCAFYTVGWALGPRRSTRARAGSILLLVVSLVVPYVWILVLLWGGVCWADARAKR